MKAAAEGPAAAALEIKDVKAMFHKTHDPEVVVMEFRVSASRPPSRSPSTSPRRSACSRCGTQDPALA